MFKECSTCFYLEKAKGIKKPRGIFPSLPGGIDRVLKNWYDTNRANGVLPPEIRTQITGSLYRDTVKLDRWRNWRAGLNCVVDGMEIGGAIDDLLVEDDGTFSPFDYKTRGSAPKVDAPDYYGHQLDAYALLLEKNGLKLSGKAYLAYYWPFSALGKSIEFSCQVEKKSVDPVRTIELARAATEFLKGDDPGPNPTCEFCSYAVNIGERVRN